MEILIKLKEQGWHLTEEGLKKIQDAEIPGAADVKKIISAALNWDFREIAGGALPTKREDTLPGRIVLQVQKIRNISAPKANEESKSAPRLLQVDLSDGQTLLQGLELEPIPSLNLNVAPGTKVYLRAERLQLMQGFAVLRAADVQVLGGRVEQLAEKWELARTMLKYARCGRRISGSSGPPPWIAFGKKLDVKEPLDTRNFRSLQAAMEKEKEGSKENEEFNAMRTEAIAEAAKAGARKVFGGGHQQILDHNVKKILERGYSEEDAQHALRTTNNNLERALYNLKRRDESKRSDNNVRNNADSALANGRSDRGSSSAREFNGKRGAANAKEVAAAVKPATNTLFDFLTEKLPANSEGAGKSEQAASPHPPTESNSSSNIKIEKSKSDVAKTSKQLQDSSAAAAAAEHRPRFENNMSSSFSANRSTGEGRRQDRESQRNSEKQSNTRYSGTSGGRSGNGRGGRRGQQKYEKTAEGDGGGRGAYQQQRRDDGGNAIRGERNSNRGRRGSHERTNAAATAQNGNGKSQQQQNAPGVASETRRDQQTKRNEKSRHNAKERSNNYEGSNNRRRDNNSNRQQNSYATAENTNNNNNNKESSAAAPNSNNNPSSNTDSSVCINKLVESTSKLKIDKSRDSGRGNQQRQRQATQQQQQQPQRQQRNHQQYSSEQKMSTSSPAPVMVQQYQPPQLHPHQQQMLMNQQPQTQANYGQQLVNGFTYDPSKIIGFQNKETNEFAMTLLKSQGIAAAMSPPLAASPAAHFMPPQSSDGSSMTAAASTQQPPSPFGKPAAFVLPTVQPPPPPLPLPPQNASDYGVPSTPACEKWSWKVGDLCFAKYWDDGRYYEAEVTGVSDKTCVVFFHGYGNHEEVLKGDCLPITDVNHLPINHFNASQQQEQPQQPAAFQQGQQNFATSASSRAVSNRYRGERQVYVPPPKRDNCN